jgi:lysophospholipase L1-like esterase
VVFVTCGAVIAIPTRVPSPKVSVFEMVPVASAAPTVRTVSVVGDSITVVSQPDISTALTGAYDAVVHGIWGQRIDQMLPTLSAALRRHPSAVVVNLGSNDAIQAQTHHGWPISFRHMIAMLAPTHCVLLTTISTLLDVPTHQQPVAARIDAAIATAVSAHRNFHVVDWNAAVHATNGLALLSTDRVHPSPAGQLTLAALIRAALDHDCRRVAA